MSASAIIDGIITSLGAASVFGSNNVSKNYKVLESSSACCCVVNWTGYNHVVTQFGGGGNRTWTFSLEVYSKDTGNASATIDKTILCIDKVAKAFEHDQTIQGTCEKINRITGSRRPGEAMIVGGFTWLPMPMSIEVLEWSDE